jgi:predicted  nucleic acid-binding Zn-ribbon protein
MPHKCVKCGREFEDGSTEILKGCPSCAGKKFLYVREEERHADVLEEKPIESIVEERKENLFELKSHREQRPEFYDRIESIRILGPGWYELNIEKLARSDDMVLGLGREGQYAVDISSMVRPPGKKAKPSRKHKKK